MKYNQMRHGLLLMPGTHLGVQIGVQQYVAGLQVQVEQSRGEIVKEVYTQSHLVSQPDNQWPGRGSM